MNKEIIELILKTKELTKDQKADIIKEMTRNQYTYYPHTYYPSPYDTHTIPWWEVDNSISPTYPTYKFTEDNGTTLNPNYSSNDVLTFK